MPLTTKAKRGIVRHMKNEIAGVKYKVGVMWHDAVVDSVTESDTALELRVSWTLQAEQEITISEIQLYDTSGDVFYSQTGNIKYDPLNEGVLSVITLEVTEVTK